jgi:hypothetical protein
MQPTKWPFFYSPDALTQRRSTCQWKHVHYRDAATAAANYSRLDQPVRSPSCPGAGGTCSARRGGGSGSVVRRVLSLSRTQTAFSLVYLTT